MKACHLFSLTLSLCTLATAQSRAQAGWLDLFNGKNLDGWSEHSGKAKYIVEDGVLTLEYECKYLWTPPDPTDALGNVYVQIDKSSPRNDPPVPTEPDGQIDAVASINLPT